MSAALFKNSPPLCKGRQGGVELYLPSPSLQRRGKLFDQFAGNVPPEHIQNRLRSPPADTLPIPPEDLGEPQGLLFVGNSPEHQPHRFLLCSTTRPGDAGDGYTQVGVASCPNGLRHSGDDLATHRTLLVEKSSGNLQHLDLRLIAVHHISALEVT